MGQKKGEFSFEKLHLIRKLKIRIFISMPVNLYPHMLSYFRAIHNL